MQKYRNDSDWILIGDAISSSCSVTLWKIHRLKESEKRGHRQIKTAIRPVEHKVVRGESDRQLWVEENLVLECDFLRLGS